MKKFLYCAIFILLLSSAAFSETAITSANFPDANFRSYVERFDTNNDGILSKQEISRVTRMDLSYYGQQEDNIGLISNMAGIEYFTALKELSCGGRGITELDVSKNAALEELSCWDNKIKTLNLRKNSSLEVLSVWSNDIHTLDVSSNIKLELLNCNDNHLTKLDLRKNTNLEWLQCINNHISELDLSGLSKIVYESARLNEFRADPQYVYGLSFAESNGKYQLDLNKYVNMLSRIKKVSGYLGDDYEYGKDIQTDYDSSKGIAVFSQKPKSVVYVYDTYLPAGGDMWVTLREGNPTYEENLPEENTPENTSESLNSRKSSSGSGGCNAGFSESILLIAIFCLNKKENIERSCDK